MDVNYYTNIVSEIKNTNCLNAYDTHYSILCKKYPSISEETLRSIISLWFQRRVTQNSWIVKRCNIYDEYKKRVASGVKEACLQIAHKLEYPPSLVAKIVLTSYLAELKSKKSQISSSEIKNLRKQQCPYCKSHGNSLSNIEMPQKNATLPDEISSVKRHHDPRVELALNLFDDDDDEIGKYFLEKFTFSNDKAKKRGFLNEKLEQKSSKFFWQASSFEEMGEKNVKQTANVEKLFSDRLRGKKLVNRSGVEELAKKSGVREKRGSIIEDGGLELASTINEMKLRDSSSIEESNAASSKSIEKSHSEILDSTFSSNDCDTSFKLLSANDTNSTFDESLNESKEGAGMKICTCGSSTVSVTSDSESEDSDEAYENFSVKELFENPSLIEDPVLARDVFFCTSFDDQYGPTADVICASSGITHEKLLEDYVKNAGLSYKTEDELRGDGFDKTPDIILLVPVAVENFVINWVESKALFADYKLHQDFEKKQFQNYINRFGPGLVIYWQGYVHEVLESDLVKKQKQIIISDRFPPKEHFTFVKSDKFKSWMQSK